MSPEEQQEIAEVSELFVIGNVFEGTLWGALGLLMCVVGLKYSAHRRDALLAAVAFWTFGASDVVETMTGAWWRPWWLLAWKAVCVLVLLWLAARYERRRRAVSG